MATTKKTAANNAITNLNLSAFTDADLELIQQQISDKLNKSKEDAKKTKELQISAANNRLSEIRTEILVLLHEVTTIVDRFEYEDYVTFEISIGDTSASYNSGDEYWSSSSY